MSDCTSTTSTRFDTWDFDSLRIGERDVFRDVMSDAADLVGVGGAGRIGRERLGCTGITQGPRSLRAVARLPPVPPRCSLLELSAIMMRGFDRQRSSRIFYHFSTMKTVRSSSRVHIIRPSDKSVIESHPDDVSVAPPLFTFAFMRTAYCRKIHLHKFAFT